MNLQDVVASGVGADTTHVRLPDGRTVSVNTRDPKEAAAAARRLLAREAIEKGPQGKFKPTAFDGATDNAVNNMTLGLSDVVSGGEAAAITAGKNLALRLQGKTPTFGAGDAYAAERMMLKDRHSSFADQHPVANTASGVAGALAMPGGDMVGNFIAKGAPTAAALAEKVPVLGKGLAAMLRSHALPAATVRSAAVGGGLGAVSGGANADPGSELQGARLGAGVGAVTGGVVPSAARVAGATAGAVGRSGTAVVRSVNKASGGKLLNADVTASRRLSEALRADGATPDQLRAGLNDWLKTGASTPTLLDLASTLPSGGQHTLRLLTGAALKGQGAGVAVKYADSVAADLQPNAIARTRALTPDARTIPQVESDVSGRIAAASAAPRVAPGSAGAQVSPALNARFDAMKSAVDDAYTAARATQGEAVLHPKASASVAQGIDEAMADFDPLNVPRVAREVDRLKSVVSPGIPDLPAGINPARVRGVGPQAAPLRPLFDARARLSQLANSTDRVEAAAASRVVRSLDGALDNAVDTGAVGGDPEAINAWRTAIGLRREMGRQFQGEDMIHALTERGRHGEGRALEVAPEDASSKILGRNGVTPRPDLTRDLTRLRDTLGPNSSEWRAVQHEGVARILSEDAGSEHFGNGWLQFEREHPELAGLLASPEQRAAIMGSREQIGHAVADRSALGTGRQVMSAGPDQFAADLGATGDRRPLAQLGAVRQIEEMIGRPAENATGLLNRLSSGTNASRNLGEAFGPEDASAYRDAIQNEIRRVRNARLIDPTLNSRTAERLDALAEVEMPKASVHNIVMGLVNKIRQGATLTDLERKAVVSLGLAEPGRTLAHLRPESAPVQEALRRAGHFLAGPSSAAAAKAVVNQ